MINFFIKQVKKEDSIYKRNEDSKIKSEMIVINNNSIIENNNQLDDKIRINSCKSITTNTTDLNSNLINIGSKQGNFIISKNSSLENHP